MTDSTETGLPSEPRLIQRAAQPYVSVRRLVSMTDLSEVADEIPGLFAWLAERGVEPAGPPFIKYNVVSSSRLDVEAGIPVATPLQGKALQGDAAHGDAAPPNALPRDGAHGDALRKDDRILLDVLPSGQFASVTHIGHPDGLLNVTAALLDWGAEKGLTWDMSETAGGQHWGLRLELYKTNPAAEPDVSKWETELLFRLAD